MAGLKSGIGLESVLFATIFGFFIIKGIIKAKVASPHHSYANSPS